MSDIARALCGDSEADHLVIGPKRTVDEHAGRGLHGGPYRLVDGGEPRRIDRGTPGALILEHQREIVARDGSIAVGRIRRRFARHRQRAPPDSRHPVDTEAGAFQIDAATVHSAKEPEHAEHGVAPGEVGKCAVGAPNGPGSDRFTQHVEPGGVVDLSVDEDDGGNGCVAHRARGLQIRIRPQLAQYIGRGIHQRPGGPGGAPRNGNGRLGACAGFHRSCPKTLAVWAIAIPLGKTAAGGGPQDPDFHPGMGAARKRGRAPSLFSDWPHTW